MPLNTDSFYNSSQKAQSDKNDKLVERDRLLNLRRLPAMLNPEETARFLGVCAHDVPILVAHGLLKPLGNPVQSSVKYFATVVLEELERDVDWLHRVRATLQDHWSMKNARKSANTEYSSLPSKKAHASSRRSTLARTPSKVS
jgi:hypothetical protein